jgi:hypothetical protein
LFGSAAGDATRAAGLLAGVSPITPAAAGVAAMGLDLGNLASAVAGVGGLNLAYVAAPRI